MPNGFHYADLDDVLGPDDTEGARSALKATQDLAGSVEPDIAAQAAKKARAEGVPMQAVLDTPQPKQKEDWASTLDTNPILARHLQRLDFARVAQKDVGALAKVEKLVAGGVEAARGLAIDVAQTGAKVKRAAERGWRTGEVARIAQRQIEDALAGRPPDPELERQARELETFASAEDVLRVIDDEVALQKTLAQGGPADKTSFLGGVAPMSAEQIALMASRGARFTADKLAAQAQAQATAPSAEEATYARKGMGRTAAESVLLTATNPAPMALQGAADEGSLFFREALAKGATPRAAAEVSRLVSVVNGSLEFVPLANVLGKVPGLSSLGGMGVRDLARRIFASPTKLAALNRFAGRLAEQAIAEGGTEYLQEWTNILAEPLATGGPMASFADANARALEAAKGGVQASLGLGAPTSVAVLHSDLREVEQSKQHVAWAQALHEAVMESATVRRDPDTAKEMVQDAVAEGSSPPVVSLPASALRELFQGEGLTEADVAAKMPRVAEALTSAAAMDDGDVEVIIPTADLAVHVAPLKGFAEAVKKLRVGDGLTQEEAEGVDKLLKEMKPEAKAEELTPAQRVFADVFEKAKGTTDQRRTAAALWAAMAESRASRGVASDAWAYYQKQTLSIREGEVQGGLMQTDLDGESLVAAEMQRLAAEPGQAELAAKFWQDPVTGLYNERAAKALPVTPASRTVGIIDVEGFKPANDEGGHATGDALLKHVAAQVQASGKVAWAAKVGNTIQFATSDEGTAQEVYRGVKAPVEGMQTALSTFGRVGDWDADKETAKGDRDARRKAKTFSERKGIPVAFLDKDAKGKPIFRYEPDKWDPKVKNPAHNEGEIARFKAALAAMPPAPALKPVALDASLEARRQATALEEQGRELYYDRKTGLLNGAGWALLRDPKRGNPRAQTMSVDVANLRVVDEMFGHGPTDNLLDAVSEVMARLSEQFGVDGAHLHGDEYGFQADSPESLADFKMALREELSEYTFVADVGGKVLVKEGIRFGAGIDPDFAKADAKIAEDKNEQKRLDSLPREVGPDEDPRSTAARWVDVGPEQGGVLARTGRRPLQGRLSADGGAVQGARGAASPEGTRNGEGAGNRSLNQPEAYTLADLESYFVGVLEDPAQDEDFLALVKEQRGDVEFARRNLAATREGAPFGTGAWLAENVYTPGTALPRGWTVVDAEANEDERTITITAKKEGFDLRERTYSILEASADARGVMVANGVAPAEAETLMKWQTDAHAGTITGAGFRAGHYFRQGARGAIRFDDAASFFEITLSKKANLSTFFHESGHAFLEMLRRDAVEGHAESQRDLDIIREFLGIPDQPLDAKELEPYLEKFARAFEAYLWEGKAPSAQLEGVFAKLKAWMRHVYHALRGLNVELTDEARQVFDRLLATDAEIQAQAARFSLVSDTPGGVAQQRALEEARKALEHEALSALREAVRNDYDRVRDEVAQDDAANPIRNAFEELRGNERLDGGPATEGLHGRKLDRETLRGMGLPPEVLKRLRAVSEMPGESVSSVIQPDDAAYLFGFDDAQDFITSLGTLPSRQDFIRQETDRRLEEIYPGFRMTPAWLEEHALKALHGRAVEAALMEDLSALGRKVGAPPARSVREVVKAAAKADVARTEINELDPELYRRQEVAAAKAWQEAMASQDIQAAHVAKRRQLYAHFAWREAAKAKDSAEKMRATLRGYEDIGARKRIGLAGPEFLQALDSLLASVELVKMTKRDAAKWTDALTAVEAQADLLVSPEVRAGALKPWGRLTVDEATAVFDAAKSIVHAAQAERRITLGKQKHDFAELVGRLSAHVEARAGKAFTPPTQGGTQNPEGLELMAKKVRASLSQLKKLEFIAIALDGGETAGFAHSLIFQPLADAEKAEVALVEETAEKFREMLDGLDQKRLTAPVEFLGTTMRRHEVLAIALNCGNEGNFQRLVDGYADRGWTRAAVLARVDALLSDKEVAFVNDAWKLVGKFWPEVTALAERVVGVAPEKVDATPHTLPSGRVLEGGYYPIVKDRDRSNVGEKMAAKAEALFEGPFMAPVVEAGFTKARAVKTTEPLLLDLRVMPRHLKKVAHYVTHYEAVKAVDRLTQNKEVAKVLRAAVSPETFNAIRPTLAAVANGGAVLDAPADFIDNVLRHARLGATVTMYGAKFTSGIMQATGLTSVAYRIGPKYVVRGLHKFMADLAAGKPFEDAASQSEVIRRAEWNLDVDINGLMEGYLSQWGKMARFKEELATFSLAWMGLVQKTVNTVAWHGAHEKALAENHPDPVAFADSVVRTTQSAAGIKDLARIQQGSETKRLFVVAYSYFSVLQNLLMLPLDGKGVQKTTAAAARIFWLVTLPVLLETALRGKTPPKGEDEPEDWLKYLTLQQITYASRGVPLLSSVMEQLLDPKNDARTAPWLTAIFKGAKAAHGAVTEDRPLSKAEIRDLGTLAGMAAKLPTPALMNLYRWASTLDAQQEPVRNLFLRSPAEFK